MNTAQFKYSEAKYESVACNLCGQSDTLAICRQDRHNLPQPSVICKNCGLIFLNPRMTASWYDRFYEGGHYRHLLQSLKKKRSSAPSPDGVFSKGEKFGLALSERINLYVKNGFTIEVGSAAGGILSALKKALNLDSVLGIEPASKEAEFARSKGIPTEIGIFENFSRTVKPAANILCIQSLNHLLDPRLFLTWTHANLTPDGRLILVVQNFESLVKKIGSLKMATQIDHTYMFLPQTLKNFVQSAGFEIVFFENWESESLAKQGLSAHHMCLVAKKVDRQPFLQIVIEPSSFDNALVFIKRMRRLYPFLLAKNALENLKRIFRIVILRQLKKSYE